ncbi:MAG: tRNA pseudouridine(55) synthase TruB [Huintestinicola sp.]
MAFVTDSGGIFCVYKPKGFTSFDVIAKMRGILHYKRLGHAGTLDPMAEGVLPVFAGNATKACDMLPDHDKVYRAGFRLGITTDTQDITGTVLKEDSRKVSFPMLADISKTFEGEIMQIPPMYSAVSVNGKRLYELAREGKTVEREPRRITVYSLEVTEYDEASRSGVMEISCSKGTYIRTLINDIGDKLGCGGIMTSLIRTAACGFTLDNCVTIEELQKEADNDGDFSKFLLPIASVFSYLPNIKLGEAQERMYKNGIRLDAKRVNGTDDAHTEYSIYGCSDNFIGAGEIMKEENLLKVKKNFF